jgi:hypothetical protein
MLTQIVTEFCANDNLQDALKNERSGKMEALDATLKSNIICGIVQLEPVVGGFHLSHLSTANVNAL